MLLALVGKREAAARTSRCKNSSSFPVGSRYSSVSMQKCAVSSRGYFNFLSLCPHYFLLKNLLFLMIYCFFLFPVSVFSFKYKLNMSVFIPFFIKFFKICCQVFHTPRDLLLFYTKLLHILAIVLYHALNSGC